MGNSPSQELYYGARAGDIPRMEKALQKGADINYRHVEKRSQTPLIVAAKHGQGVAVRWLLSKGAKDYRSTDGQTAMHEAARMGYDRVVSVLLDRGSDHFSRNTNGERAIDRAALYNNLSIVRLIEARTCPFFGLADMEQSGWFATYYEPRWLAIHRARPNDNPAVSRSDNKLCIYTNQQTSTPEYEFIKPQISPISTDVDNNVIVDLTPESILYKGHAYAASNNPQTAHKIKPFRFKLTREMYNWMNSVLSPTFATGMGPAFEDNTGNVRMPAFAKAYIQNFSHLSAVDVVGHAPPVAIGQHIPTPDLRNNSNPSTSVVAVPLDPLPSNAVPSYAVLTPLPPLPSTATSSSSSSTATALPSSTSTSSSSKNSSTPSYITSAVTQLLTDLDNNQLKFDIDIPDEYLCPISTDLMIDPVVAEDGHTYSRTGITQCLQLKKTSPLTNEHMNDNLIPNHHLRGQILDWIEHHRIKQSNSVPTLSSTSSIPVLNAANNNSNVRRPSTPLSDWVIVESSIPIVQPPRVSNSPLHVGGSNLPTSNVMGVPTPSRSYQPTSLPPLSPAARTIGSTASALSNGIRSANSNSTTEYYTDANDFPSPPTGNSTATNRTRNLVPSM